MPKCVRDGSRTPDAPCLRARARLVGEVSEMSMKDVGAIELWVLVSSGFFCYSMGLEKE
jgi:hypothetical protein